METSPSNAWYELLVAGRGDAVDSLVKELDPALLFRGEDLALRAESLPERILERLGAKTHHLLLAPADLARHLIRRIETSPPLHLDRLREVQGASFAFTAEAYSHREAEKIKRALHTDLPDGVACLDCDESEEIDPEAKSVELYAPCHPYTWRASGRFTGPPPEIFAFYQRMREIDFVKEKALEIEGREIPSPEV